MLQQTQVATAIPYFGRWLHAFPTVGAVAEAELEEILRHWEGLGYYSRARNLHRTARQVVSEFGGRFPADPGQLARLPGIGPYTAAAIASIAFGVPVVAVDANVKRVASRLFARQFSDVGKIGAELAPLQPASRAGDFNEALMELGATLCSVRAPSCGHCPLRDHCRAHQRGTEGVYPAPKRRAPKPRRLRYALVHIGPNGVALQRRGPDGLLPGLWGFVQSEHPPGDARLLDPVRHSYTHFDLTLIPALVTTAPPESVPIGADALGDIAASRVDRKVLELLRQQGHQLGPGTRTGQRSER